jgi:hypothetical protein
MKTREAWILLWIAGVVGGTCGGATKESEPAPALQPAVASLLDAIRHAARPARSMRVEWIYETVDPLYAIPGRPLGQGEVPHFVKEYAATVKGACSRIERVQKTYETIKSEEPKDISSQVAVFDGRRQLILTSPVKGVPITRTGAQHQTDENSFVLSDALVGWPMDLNNAELVRSCSFRLVSRDANGISVLEITEKKGGICLIAVDGNRGSNIIKLERFSSPDTKYLETSFKLRQYANGIWYVAGRETIRYWPGTTPRKAHIEDRMRVTKAEFDVEVPDSLFTLEFPPGTKVWDDALQGSYVVAPPEEPTDQRSRARTNPQNDN